MTATTDEVVAQATENLDDNLQPLGDPPAEVPAPTETPEEGKDPKDEGFTADELEETPEVETPPSPEPTPANVEGMDAETKYIFDNLPNITARIKDGDGVKEIQLKSPTQLPENFEFASKRDEVLFMNAVSAQENRALQLQSTYQQQQQSTQNQQFEERENAMIRDDVAELQKEGELPKFKTQVGDPEFEKDPATQEVQKVLDFMEERNQQYLNDYNQGRPYRHIGFREAYYMFQRTGQSTQVAQQQEDRERKEIANRTTTPRGLVPTELKKPTVPRGTTVQDILNRIDAEW